MLLGIEGVNLRSSEIRINNGFEYRKRKWILKSDVSAQSFRGGLNLNSRVNPLPPFYKKRRQLQRPRLKGQVWQKNRSSALGGDFEEERRKCLTCCGLRGWLVETGQRRRECWRMEVHVSMSIQTPSSQTLLPKTNINIHCPTFLTSTTAIYAQINLSFLLEYSLSLPLNHPFPFPQG
jgi:hypothetical protein